MSKNLSIDQLKAFSPLDGLKRDNLFALQGKISLQEAKSGETLFRKGDTDKNAVYVFSGKINLKEGNEVFRTITGGTAEAFKPISPGLPRDKTAVAVDTVEYFSIDNDLLDVTLTWDQTGIYEVGDLGSLHLSDEGDWMTALLQVEAFQKIPPANIQTIFARLEQVNYKAGDTVIKQGDEGDYFYVVNRGSCAVTREMALDREGILLDKLTVGDTFGEEALISEAKRNATVTMLTDGALMRLGKDDFQKLLTEPILRWLDEDKASQVVADGGQWLDVRLPSEFDTFHKDGAVNIPLYMLRMKLNKLDSKKEYAVYCDTGRRSSAAAFILSKNGFKAVVVRGGLSEG